MPPPGSLFGAVLFGAIGMGAFVHDRRVASAPVVVIAMLLMVYPYAVSQAWLVYAIGALLCYGLYHFRK